MAAKQFRKNLDDLDTKSYSDEYLLRWLKAKNFNSRKAAKALRSFVHTRQVYRLDHITKEYKKAEVVEKYEFAAFMGFDKEGSPVHYIPIGGADCFGFLNVLSTFDVCLYCSYYVEKLLELQREHDQKTGQFHEGGISAIFDFSNFSLKQIAYKPVIETGLDLMRMFQENYPGLVDRVLVVNAPLYFSTVFSIFKPILRMDILDKLEVASEDSSPSLLLKYIDAEVLPEFLGGKRVDENGNTCCTAFLKYPVDVPENLYKSNLPKLELSDPGVSEIIVPARSTQDFLLNVNRSDSKIRIEFWSDDTIGLKIYFRESDENRNGLFSEDNYLPNGKSNEEGISPYAKVQSHLTPVDTTINCFSPGTYVFRFDNTFSWVNSKRIVHRIQIVPETL